ncbi:hypothetical protein [Ruania halotolerans]|uniref:hypothetical protein n=1 Tax=Ruania halotolerans TaxID=2897773 RepID=UPI001E333F9D|nr:hypothetical protein [Ruania halotolerans]UFU05984.1 hypothetical protein LQF10_16395 [Ruania halotolerans]
MARSAASSRCTILCGVEVIAVSDVTRCVIGDGINFITATLEFDTGAVGVMITN